MPRRNLKGPRRQPLRQTTNRAAYNRERRAANKAFKAEKEMVRNLYKVPSKPSKSPRRERRKKSTYSNLEDGRSFKVYYLVAIVPIIGIPILIAILIFEELIHAIKKIFPIKK